MVALTSCNVGVNVPGTGPRTPTQLTALDAARSIKGTIFVAQGGRIWKLRAGKVTVLTGAGQQLAYPTASADLARSPPPA